MQDPVQVQDAGGRTAATRQARERQVAAAGVTAHGPTSGPAVLLTILTSYL